MQRENNTFQHRIPQATVQTLFWLNILKRFSCTFLYKIWSNFNQQQKLYNAIYSLKCKQKHFPWFWEVSKSFQTWLFAIKNLDFFLICNKYWKRSLLINPFQLVQHTNHDSSHSSIFACVSRKRTQLRDNCFGWHSDIT